MQSPSILVAHARKFVIGKDGKIPWKIPTEMAHFKETTMDEGRGSNLFMGRKTFESLSGPLARRFNFIFSRQGSNYIPKLRNVDTFVFDSLIRAYTTCEIEPLLRDKKKIVIGGEEIYRAALLQEDQWRVREIIASEIDADIEGDTFFPAPDYSLWNKEILREVSRDEKNPFDYTVVRYTR
jgi:dihydrofolate reductase